MNKERMEYRFGIGVPTLIMLFSVLCLTTLGVLALTNGRSDLALTQRSMEMTAGYYQASAKAQETLAKVDEMLLSCRTEGKKMEDVAAFAAAENMELTGDTLSFAVDAGADRQLSVSLRIASLDSPGPRYTLLVYALSGEDELPEPTPLNLFY